jgi:hypothetical protein
MGVDEHGTEMNDFIDLEAASGAQLRFRIWPDGSAHLPVAGNFVLLRANPDGPDVLVVGATNDLSGAPALCGKAAAGEGLHLFTRLNISRNLRLAEHEDLAARYPTARTVEAAR